MKEKNQFNCPVEATLSLIGGKYKPLILWHLIDQPLHYMELQRLIPNATPKMLSQQLHDLEDCGMIHREVIPEKPPKTIYSLTTFGQSIIPLLDAMPDSPSARIQVRIPKVNAVTGICHFVSFFRVLLDRDPYFIKAGLTAHAPGLRGKRTAYSGRIVDSFPLASCKDLYKSCSVWYGDR